MQNEIYTTELDRYFTLWRMCKAMYENWSKTYGFSCNETLVLNYIANNRQCTQKQISDCLQISKQTINMILKRFESDGLVEMSVNDMDKRSKFIKLTEKGSKASAELISDLFNIEVESVKKMGVAKFRMMNDGQEEYIKLFHYFAGLDD